MDQPSPPSPLSYRRALFATGAILAAVAVAFLAWSVLDPGVNMDSLKLNEAIVDEASAAPPITGSIDGDRAGP